MGFINTLGLPERIVLVLFCRNVRRTRGERIHSFLYETLDLENEKQQLAGLQ
jgi:hypothetical protein